MIDDSTIKTHQEKQNQQQLDQLNTSKTADQFDQSLAFISNSSKTGVLSKKELEAFKESLEVLKDPCSIMGHIKTKPYGYAGDFHIIDRIYTYNKSRAFPYWDEYALNNAAAKAVRNRKTYFIEQISSKLPQGGELLNVASGPARDLFELFETFDIEHLKVTCVEQDPVAIKYAKSLNQEYSKKIAFHQKNVFRYNPNEKYNLIWSAGLFDYFNDKAFVNLLTKFKSWLAPGGEIIIGNFNADHNPSRTFMEVFGEWFLNHRTETQLIELALEAGFKNSQINIGQEAEGVNLFLHLTQ